MKGIVMSDSLTIAHIRPGAYVTRKWIPPFTISILESSDSRIRVQYSNGNIEDLHATADQSALEQVAEALADHPGSLKVATPQEIAAFQAATGPAMEYTCSRPQAICVFAPDGHQHDH
jgi:hypothetical protein